MKSFIFLENIELFAHHGVLEQETTVGNVFIVNLKLEVDLQKASETDDLNDTVSYADIFEVIKQEMAIPSKLLEHVGGRIVRRIKREFASVKKVELRLSKRNPPMSGQIGFAGIIIEE